MPSERRPGARTIEAVERAVAALGALAEGGELGTNELARRMHVHPSSVSRLLATLEDGGLVVHSSSSGKYRLGPRLVELGHAALGAVDLRELARPHLRALVEATGETATLSVPGDRDAVTVDFVQSPQAVASVARLGRPSVGHATAVGKVMLAFGGVAPARPLERFTATTIVDPTALDRELATIRRLGFAEALEEREIGLSAAAVPVFGPGRELVAILGVQGPADRLPRQLLRQTVPFLEREAATLGLALGGAPHHA